MFLPSLISMSQPFAYKLLQLSKHSSCSLFSMMLDETVLLFSISTFLWVLVKSTPANPPTLLKLSPSFSGSSQNRPRFLLLLPRSRLLQHFILPSYPLSPSRCTFPSPNGDHNLSLFSEISGHSEIELPKLGTSALPTLTIEFSFPGFLLRDVHDVLSHCRSVLP